MPRVARKPRQLLALLLLNYSRVVPLTASIDELWATSAPKTARAAVQIYIHQLRKQLAEVTGRAIDEVSGEMLRTVRNGYEFVAEDLVDFDLRTYHRLERTGTAAMADSDLTSASRYFRAALALWRGPALTDVEPGPGIRAAVAGLDQSRATMLGHRIEVELRRGRHREILDELTELVSHDRFHEDLHAQLLLALYRSGYRTRALEAFHRLRKDMAGTFGLDPSPRLHWYYHAVLTSDPRLDEVSVLPLPKELPIQPR